MKMNGGQIVVGDGHVLASLGLPIAGLLSDRSLETVCNNKDELNTAAQECGSDLPDPFLHLSFLTLPTLPSLRITNKGLVDVQKSQFIDLFTM